MTNPLPAGTTPELVSSLVLGIHPGPHATGLALRNPRSRPQLVWAALLAPDGDEPLADYADRITALTATVRGMRDVPVPVHLAGQPTGYIPYRHTINFGEHNPTVTRGRFHLRTVRVVRGRHEPTRAVLTAAAALGVSRSRSSMVHGLCVAPTASGDARGARRQGRHAPAGRRDRRRGRPRPRKGPLMHLHDALHRLTQRASVEAAGGAPADMVARYVAIEAAHIIAGHQGDAMDCLPCIVATADTTTTTATDG